jgi:DNA helicase-2/ATP-dependent DNA helicase PcrA
MGRRKIKTKKNLIGDQTKPNPDLFAGLNETQRAVVEHDSGNAAMYAVAGAGKTRTVVHRIAYMVRDKKISGDDILAVTFTKKAAGEMNERLKALGITISQKRGDGGARVGTFHSLCLEILRDGSPWKHFEVDAENRMKYKLKDILGWRDLDWRGCDLTEVMSFIGQCKNELISPEDCTDETLRDLSNAGVISYPDRRYIAAYERYEDVRNRAGLMTFDDMLYLAVRYLRSDQSARDRWGYRYNHIIVDEYQDSNTAQYELIKLLNAGTDSLLVVGDDDQLIYSFRGSKPEYTLSFKEQFSAREFFAEKNYRSQPEILDIANRVIRYNDPARIQKQNQAQRKNESSTNPVSFVNCETTDNEAETIVEQIKARVADGIEYKDIVILYRTNALSRAHEEVMLREKIPHVVVGGTDFYSRKEVADILAYIAVAVDSSDNRSLLRCINKPFRFIGRVTLDQIKDTAKSEGLTCLQVVREHNGYLSVNRRQRQSLDEFVSIIDELCERLEHNNEETNEQLPNVISWLIASSGYEKWLLSDEGSNTSENDRTSNLKELVRTSERFGSAVELMEHVAEICDMKSKKKDGMNAVQLMTIHKSKGLEFPVVFLSGCSQGILPHARSGNISEERRLYYVGVTRARDELIVTWPDVMLVGDKIKILGPSQFVAESRGEKIETPI